MEFNRLQVWENKIKIDIKDTGWEGVDWIYLAGVGAKLGGGGVMNTVMNFRVSKNASYRTVSFSRRNLL